MERRKRLDFIDPNIVNTCPVVEALRWIHIGVLSAEDEPANSPTTS